MSALAFPNGRVSAYAYDDAQRLTSIDTSFNGQSLWRETYTLDAEGDRTRRADTALGVLPATSTSYLYDGLLRLTSLVRTLTQTGTPLGSETFTLDPATNIASRTGPTATYSYDQSNRVTSDGTRSFTFDGADRLTGRGSDTFGYDALSRLTSATVTSASPAASASSLYAYDGDGLLRSRTASGATTGYLWDTSVGIAQLLQAGSERVVYGLGPLYRVHADGSYDVFIRDALGSVRAEVSGSGTLSNAFDYTAYGELRDPAGLIYLRARWYDPGVGRFVTRDSLDGVAAWPRSLNGLAYALGAPTRDVDSTGMCADPGGVRARYCIEAFIPQDSMLGFAGDARGAMSNGGSYRFRQTVSRSAEGALTTSIVPGVSRFGPVAREAEMGLCGGRTSGDTMTQTCSASDGLAFGLAPWVGYFLKIQEGASGGSVQHVYASAWPSLEVWEYQDGHNPRLLFFNDASSRGILNTGWRDFEIGPGK